MSPETEREKNIGIIQQLLEWGVFPQPDSVKDVVDKISKNHPRLSQEEVLGKLYSQAKMISAGQGIVAALPGTVPGFGTAAQLAVSGATALPDTVALLRKMAHLQLCTAYVYGHDIWDPNDSTRVHADRCEEFGVIMGIMTGTVIPAKEAAKRFGGKFVTVQISRHIPASVLRAINRKVGFTLLTKFGTQRGGIALGKVIPLGVGAAIGGGMNYHAIHQFGKSARKFYGEGGTYAYSDE